MAILGLLGHLVSVKMIEMLQKHLAAFISLFNVERMLFK